MVVLHQVFVAVVVVLAVVGDIMGGIDLDPPAEHMGSRVRSENMTDQRLAFFAHGDASCMEDSVNGSIQGMGEEYKGERENNTVLTDRMDMPAFSTADRT